MATEAAAIERGTDGRIIGVRALSTKQEQFAKLAATGVPVTVAARLAGYAEPNAESARLRRNPAVRAKMFEIRQKRLEQGAGLAPGVLVEVMTDGKQPGATRVQAAKLLLELAGHGPKAAEPEKRVDDLREVPLADLERIVRERFEKIKKTGSGATIDNDAGQVVPSGTVAPPQVIDIAAETLPSEGNAAASPAGEGAEPGSSGGQAPGAADP